MLTHYNIKAYVEGETLVLAQTLDCEAATVYLSVDQLLQIADKVRGITRPDPEAEESRKLRVLCDHLSEVAEDEDFRDVLIHGQRLTDWLEKVDGLHTLAFEFAYGLRPFNEPPATAQKPQSDSMPTGRAKHQPDQENASAIPETMPLPIL